MEGEDAAVAAGKDGPDVDPDVLDLGLVAPGAQDLVLAARGAQDLDLADQDAQDQNVFKVRLIINYFAIVHCNPKVGLSWNDRVWEFSKVWSEFCMQIEKKLKQFPESPGQQLHKTPLWVRSDSTV